MELVIRENPDLENEKVIIECRRLTGKYIRAIEVLKSQDTIIAYKNASIYKIDLDNVYYFECVEKKIFVYTYDDMYESKQSLSDIESALNDDFIRISRSTILQIHRIESLRPILNGRLEVRLDNDEKLIVSRQYVKLLKGRFLNSEL